MDLTPETLRSATFRDKLRGYHPDDVDEFLESVARGLEVLLARLRDATEKARGAAAPVEPPLPSADEAVKTLALAQRTADLAIGEATAEAERLLKAAEQKARGLVAQAEESAAQLAERAQAELRADLEKLQAARDQLSGEVKAFGSWLEGERSRIRRALIDVADRVDKMREAGDAPVAKPVLVPAPPREKGKASKSPKAAAPAAVPTPVPAPAPVAESSPSPVEKPKPTSPPPAAPAAQAKGDTPPTGQPPVRAKRPAPTPARAQSPTGEEAVLNRAQQGVVDAVDDEDPFFRDLRAAMLDQTPLGPRDDDDQPR